MLIKFYLLGNSKVDYFTADIKVFPNDSGKGNRQQLFYRAISTLPNLRIIKGRYTVHPVEMPLAAGFPFSSKKVKVMKFEEKGSDVNLACHMLRDAYQPNSIKTIVVISNDSDLEEPIKICAQELDKYVYVLNPHIHHRPHLNSNKLQLNLSPFARTCQEDVSSQQKCLIQMEIFVNLKSGKTTPLQRLFMPSHRLELWTLRFSVECSTN